MQKHGNVFKNWLCPNFLLLPKKSELPIVWGGGGGGRPPPPPPPPLALPARTPMILKSSSKRKLHTQPIFFTSGLHKPIFPRNIIKID